MRVLRCLFVTALATVGSSAWGVVTILVEQVGPDVVYSGSGQLDLTGLTPVTTYTNNNTLNLSSIDSSQPEFSNAVVGNIQVYTGFLYGPSNFGNDISVSAEVPNAATGDFFVIDEDQLMLPADYAGATILNFSGSFPNQSLSTLWLVPGTYKWNWANDQVYLQVAAVPEPATSALICAGIIGLLTATRRMQRI
ncbi:PEP-CTERM sorting domain-containing protein [Puniceicoccus vermicola]|uniref:PEP-CTERM sorting domain-containing protein n=1 Tax=Puniceicoccus vermicola TaxID=388746 RepID=A0A7X1AUL6_9BACT|nr:PEP-CTERM sorting domain-containing protein [Puniceicoccus vermicola]MBC2600308.1 PEP-CTERM sorting domain-containing protein [Puniceicoccus vermicola]